MASDRQFVAFLRLTGDEDSQLDRAVDKAQQRTVLAVSKQSVLYELVSDFCRSQGFPFAPPSRRRRGRRAVHSHHGTAKRHTTR